MSRPVLVAYASKHGSTAEVAEVIAASLCEHGLEVDVRRADDVEETTGYGGVVLGGALYMGRMHRDARRFLQRRREALAALPVAVFAMGPRTLDAKDVASSRAQLGHALAKVPEVEPFAVTVFGGVMRGSDARDWDAIHAWAEEIGARFGCADQPAAQLVSAGATVTA